MFAQKNRIKVEEIELDDPSAMARLPGFLGGKPKVLKRLTMEF